MSVNTVMVKWLKYISIHDVLTFRGDVSDPTNSEDRGAQPPGLPIRTSRRRVVKRDPPFPTPVNLNPNLRYVSIHDVLTDRQDNSDPTESKDKS